MWEDACVCVEEDGVAVRRDVFGDPWGGCGIVVFVCFRMRFFYEAA